ncbi:MAG: hypothetical protein V4547_09465 [Bacteroidota bacterium]
MAINTLFKILLFSFISSNMLLAQGTEEQRKYLIKDEKALLNFINSSGQLEGLSLFNHSQYTYFDLYLDTPEFDLYKNKLSLRFRKRIFSDTLVTYGLQLKSEMETYSSVRMEIEEKELGFYRVKTDKGWIELPKILDVIFSQIQNNKFDISSVEFQQALSSIQKWIQLNSGSTISPFQKIAFLKLKGLGTEKIATIKPMIVGSEKRIRSHIYIDPAKTIIELRNMPMNSLELSTVPDFFKKNNSFNWILETSVDSAVFYSLFKTNKTQVEIFEFEVENKYFLHEKGTEIMNLFEKNLKSNFQMENLMDSKYRQSIKKFLVP